MKRLMTTLAVMVMMVTSAAAMSFSKARKEALFLSDKMAYELSLSLSQYEAVYEINLDYFLGLYNPADLDGVYWLRRNADLRYVLSEWQWLRYTTIPDFYRPMSWVRRHTFSLVLRNRYYDAAHFYYDRPAVYYNFRGGHNTGHTSFYANRDFHRPTSPGATMHYGSSSPASHGTTRGSTRGTASYHIGSAGVSGGNAGAASRPATTNNGNARTGSTRSNNAATQYNADAHHHTPSTKTQPATSRPESFSGSQRGARRSTTTTTTTTTTSTTRSSNNASTSRGSSSGSSRSTNSGSTRGNSGGSRGR